MVMGTYDESKANSRLVLRLVKKYLTRAQFVRNGATHKIRLREGYLPS
jgi:hypothetical protein